MRNNGAQQQRDRWTPVAGRATILAVTGADPEANDNTIPIRDAGDATLFATCPMAERDVLRSLAVPLRVAAGEDIVGQGDFGATIGVVIEGQASVWRNDEHLTDLAAGDCFGELAVLAPPGSTGQRAARVRADTEVRVDTIARAELVSHLSDIPSIAEKLREQAASY